ncbi:15896_t:CDS:1 [Cetraspora pellucida]|uniref:15896_t:CDS:1 n=1 Tax=Cetraspora pellucida TaxID=1433469 RepID=A0ACA9L0I0_9GLOM|nr:15896_t:CDS:1 [Cetraspora pellucida]
MDKSSHIDIHGSKDPNTADTNLDKPQLYQAIVNIPNEPTLTPAASTYNNVEQPPKYITTQPQPIQYPSFPASIQNGKFPLNDDKPVLIKLCKICQESDLIEDKEGTYVKGKLISPCKCTGSMQYVHIGCLNQWRASSAREDSSYQCEICKYEYKFYRPTFAKIIASPIFLHLVTILMFLLVLYSISWIVKLIDIRIKKGQTNYDKSWMDAPMLGLKLIHIIYGICIVSIMSICYMVFDSCRKGYHDTRDSYFYCGGCNCFTPWCFWGAPSELTDLSAIALVIYIIMFAIMIMIGIIFTLCTGYLLLQKNVNAHLNGIKERILEVEKEL